MTSTTTGTVTSDSINNDFFSGIMGLLTITFCEIPNVTNNTFPDDMDAIMDIKETAADIMMALCVLGICGNWLNLKTLQTSSLQTVPFMYIRALAIFDMIGLCSVMAHLLIPEKTPYYFICFWRAHITRVIINSCFIGGLYCAFMLTLERYLLISHPHYRVAHPRRVAKICIVTAFISSFLLHLPISIQFVTIQQDDGLWFVSNNIELLCSEPYNTLFTYYKFCREMIRLCVVITMTALNAIIANKLQITKKRRREMCLRSATGTAAMLGSTTSTPSVRSSIAISMDNIQRAAGALRGGHSNGKSKTFNSFTEKKLTMLMMLICLIYVLGNVPQMIVMTLTDASKEYSYNFQMYRAIGNGLEVLNHCLNFYVFCMASSEYSRAFLLNCSCIRKTATRVPGLRRWAVPQATTGASVVSVGPPRENTQIELKDMSTSSGGRKISAITNEGALTSSQEECRRMKRDSLVTKAATSSLVPMDDETRELIRIPIDDPTGQVEDEERKPLRGILVNPTRKLSYSLRGVRQKRSLTILNDDETIGRRESEAADSV